MLYIIYMMNQWPAHSDNVEYGVGHVLLQQYSQYACWVQIVKTSEDIPNTELKNAGNIQSYPGNYMTIFIWI